MAIDEDDERLGLLMKAPIRRHHNNAIICIVCALVFGAMIVSREHVLSPVSKLDEMDEDSCDAELRPHLCPPDYVFALELVYAALSLDGKEKVGLSFNGAGFQGPTLTVPKGAIVRVDVKNSLPDQGLTVHFHGIHQRGTPFFDGAHGLTQAAIPPLGGKMSYQFAAWPPGTHWYHSHVGAQLVDGAKGLLIVQDEDDGLDQFREERAIMFYDWLPKMMAAEYAVLAAVFGNSMVAKYGNVINGEPCCGDDSGPAAGLINGRPMLRGDMHPDQGYVLEVPLGRVVRLRLCNGGWLEEAAVRVDGHSMIVVAKDGVLTKRVLTHQIAIRAAERYDALLLPREDARAGDEFQFLVLLTSRLAQMNATLRYVPALDNRSASYEPSFDAYLAELDINAEALANRRVFVTDTTKVPTPPDHVTHRLALHLRLGVWENGVWRPGPEAGQFASRAPLAKRLVSHTLWTINNNSWLDPTLPLYLTKGRAGVSTVPNFQALMYDFPLNAVVDLVVFAGGKPNVTDKHPFHLHGHRFWLVHAGRFNITDHTRAIPDDQQLLQLLDVPSQTPSLQADTFPVQTGHFYIFRFIADNPGIWHFHCHLLMHMLQGLQVAINVAEQQHPRIPKMWFDAHNAHGAYCPSTCNKPYLP